MGDVVVPRTELAMEPELWTVALRDGRTLRVLAHSWSVDGDDCVFSLLFKGAPHVIQPVLRIPRDLLAPDQYDR